jgi:NAD(P)-dependent dehydrogenase (short-subunit alcohol dehydrogenase family)
MREMGDLKGKVALVTGAARKYGLGRNIAVHLAREGVSVAVVGRSEASALESEKQEGWKGLDSVVDEIEGLGCRALGMKADISDSEQVKAMVKECVGQFGQIDILVNNAGMTGPLDCPLVELEEEIWERVLSVNLSGPFLCCKAVAKIMIARGEGGKIINISSRRSKMARAGAVAYCASKAGLNALTRTLALELAPHKINVNAVCPNLIATTGVQRDRVEQEVQQRKLGFVDVAEQMLSKRVCDIPLGRLGKPDDIANMVTFLASSKSDYMTGQAINVTGGQCMW